MEIQLAVALGRLSPPPSGLERLRDTYSDRLQSLVVRLGLEETLIAPNSSLKFAKSDVCIGLEQETFFGRAALGPPSPIGFTLGEGRLHVTTLEVRSRLKERSELLQRMSLRLSDPIEMRASLLVVPEPRIDPALQKVASNSVVLSQPLGPEKLFEMQA
jgi:hypothetical protein